MTIPVLLEDLVFLGDTRSRYELLVFAQANPARLPLAMGLVQPDIPARRMANDRKIQLTDALVRILVRFLTPVTVETELLHDKYYRERLLPLAAHGDGHVLAVTIAMLLAIGTHVVRDRRVSPYLVSRVATPNDDTGEQARSVNLLETWGLVSRRGQRGNPLANGQYSSLGS